LKLHIQVGRLQLEKLQFPFRKHLAE